MILFSQEPGRVAFSYYRIKYQLDRSNRVTNLLNHNPNIIQCSVATNVARMTHSLSECSLQCRRILGGRNLVRVRNRCSRHL